MNHWLIPIMAIVVVPTAVFALAIAASIFVEVFEWFCDLFSDEDDD